MMVFKSLNGDAPNYLKQMFVPYEKFTHNTRNHYTGLLQFHTDKSSGQKALLLQVVRFGILFLKDVQTSQTIGDTKLKL